MQEIEIVCVIGAGFMGSQIGLTCASCGLLAWLVDINENTLHQAVQRIQEELERRVEAGEISEREKTLVFSRLRFTTRLKEAAAQADLAIESVPERLETKRTVFAQLDAICPLHTILATNSSSICISAIEDATHRLDRVLNMHFYPPVWTRPMVELMRGSATSEETVRVASRFARRIGMAPLLVHSESTGFLFNRIWRAIKKECLTLVDEGVASFEDVDRAWMIALNVTIGPFGLMDMVGLDVVRDIEMVYYRQSGATRDYPPQMLLDKIERGELGMKSGQGFYSYPNPAFKASGWLQGEIEQPDDQPDGQPAGQEV